MGTTLPQFYTDCRVDEVTLGGSYELVMLASHSVTYEPLYILKSLDGGLTEAVPFEQIGKTWRVDHKRKL